MHGYAAYAHENVTAYLDLIPNVGDAILALSSGFMVYPPSIHADYEATREAIARSRTTFVLLPALDLEICVAETVRRQLGRFTPRRDAAREEAVIRDRFGRYLSLPARKVETMRLLSEVVEAIHVQLARGVPHERSTSDDLVQPVDDPREFLRRYARQSAPDAFRRQRSNLTDLHPRSLR